MNTLLILFVGILGYAHCAQLDHHTCDRLAVNIKRDKDDDGSDREGMDADNQLIDLGDFLDYEQGEFFVARASNRADLGNKYHDYCFGSTFGEGCGPIRHMLELFLREDLPNDPTHNYYGDDIDLVGKIRMQIEAHSYNILTGKTTRFVHSAKLINGDDMIWKVDKDDVLLFMDAESGVTYKDTPELEYMIEELTKPFAINQLISDEHTQRIVAIVYISCDEKYSWTTYPAEVADENMEGKYAKQIEEAMFNLDVDHNAAIQNDPDISDEQKTNDFDYQKVKPVSTTFPEDVDYKTIQRYT